MKSFYVMAASTILTLASLQAKAQDDKEFPAWENEGHVSGTTDDVYQIDNDNFSTAKEADGVNYHSWLMFGRLSGHWRGSWTGNGTDNTARAIGFVAAEATYHDWYKGHDKRIGSRDFQAMHLGYMHVTDAHSPGSRSRRNIMTLYRDGSVLFRNGGVFKDNIENKQNQILFGHLGTNKYQHAIRTAHNTSAPEYNSINFYVWKQGTDSDTTPGTQHVMSIDGYGGGSVGIGNIDPFLTLDVKNNGVIGTSATSVNQHDPSNVGIKVSVGAVSKLNRDEFTGMRIENVRSTKCGNSSDIRLDTWECGVSPSREVMRITGRGNVGIGTKTPGTKLEINNGTTNGAIKIVDGTQGQGKVLTSDADGVGTWQPAGSASDGDAWGVNGEDQTSLISRTGTVQVGASNSGNIKLMAGSGAQAGYLNIYKGNGSTRLGYIGFDNTNMMYYADNGASHVFEGGKVGIGTSTPGTKLEINNGTTNGAIKIVDGTQGQGKVLTSDANGVGTWQPAASGSDGDAWGVTGENQTGAIIRRGTVVVGSYSGGAGSVSIGADNNQAGFMSIFKPSGNRLAYIGADTIRMVYSTDGGANHVFVGGNMAVGVLDQLNNKFSVDNSVTTVSSVTNATALFHGGSGTSNARLAIESNWTGVGTRPESVLEFWNNGRGGNPGQGASIGTSSQQGSGTAKTTTDLLFSTAADSTAPRERMRISSSGDVGVGTSSPSSKLHLVTEGTRTSEGNTITLTSGVPVIKTSLRIAEGSTSTSSVYEGGFGIRTFGDAAHDHKQWPFLNIETLQPNVPIIMEVGDKPIMQLFQNQVLIGPNLPFPAGNGVAPFEGQNYTLGVRGRIIASGLTCKALSAWADYVFDDSYKLQPLDEVADYVAKNKHLPDVPSGKELQEKGLDVAEMLKIQMQKIEELTLHSIRQEKEISELKKQLKH